jgi:hypothetical protein
MKRVQQDGFARPFAEIWQHTPFQPNTGVAGFLERFQKAGQFDAELFWEFVAARVRGEQPKKPLSRVHAGFNRYSNRAN